MTKCIVHSFDPISRRCECGLSEQEYIAAQRPRIPITQRHVLIADPSVKKYINYNAKTSIVSMEQRHVVRGITLDDLPRDKLGGILFTKLMIIAGAVVEPEALSWVLSMLRDVKDEPSGIGT